MGKVARQVVEQAGIDVNVLIDKLVRAASGARGLVLGVFAEGPSGHFQRGVPGSSPSVSRFLTADFKQFAALQSGPGGRDSTVQMEGKFWC